MTRNEEQAVLAKGVWCDSYNFYLKYHGRPADPGFWEEATADFGKIMKKYLPESNQWRCRVDQDKERDGVVHA